MSLIRFKSGINKGRFVKLPVLNKGVSRQGKYLFQIASLNPVLISLWLIERRDRGKGTRQMGCDLTS
ncbi:MAG: hypothetical protein A2V65_01050 [Deltaproteobacteria bacterium RBG_13_49_15]|nr:MAG: hypothetical protein A2V65_01050 [Deltaproteobacteria bacterium RBG_13_49_15]